MADKFPEFSDWKAPWEKSGQDFDEARAKGLIYSLSKSEHESGIKIAEIKAERDGYKTKVDEIERKDETEVERLRREVKERDDKLAQGADDNASTEVLRLQVALEKGLTLVQAKRLVGKTKEELLADADDLLRSFGGSGKSDSDDDEDSNDDGRRQPRGRHRPVGNDDTGGKTISPEEFAKRYGRQ